MQQFSEQVVQRFLGSGGGSGITQISHQRIIGARYRVASLSSIESASTKLRLTLHPQVKGKQVEDDVGFPVWSEWVCEDGVPFLEVPRYYGMETFGCTGCRDDRVLGKPLSQGITFQGTLFSGDVVACANGSNRQLPPQQQAVDAAMRVLHSPIGGCLLQLGCGQGKTVCAIALTHNLGRRTAILVNNGKTLLPQWVERLSSFLPSAKVGIVRANRNDLADANVDIVVCVIQSLMKRQYNQAVMDTVGTVIVDECHHIGARVFGQCMRQFHARYTIALKEAMPGGASILLYPSGAPEALVSEVSIQTQSVTRSGARCCCGLCSTL